MQQQIRIVLIETSHSGNIGSVARAMKTMGLTRLYLVSPKRLDEQAIALAAGAADIVENAVIIDSFEQAVADCSLVIGTSARLRHLQNTLIDPPTCADHAFRHAQQGGQVAWVFGRERVGLTNDELLKCHYHVNIPANPDYSSLNLAMAVQILCYEWRLRQCNPRQAMPLSTVENTDSPAENTATAQDLEYFFTHTETLYRRLGFIQNAGVMKKLRRLYHRTQLEKNELAILRGMLSAVEKRLNLFKAE